MRLLVLLIITTLSSFTFALTPLIKWSVNDNIKTPESIYYASEVDKIFVSSINGEGTKKDGKGHISMLSKYVSSYEIFTTFLRLLKKIHTFPFGRFNTSVLSLSP